MQILVWRIDRRPVLLKRIEFSIAEKGLFPEEKPEIYFKSAMRSVHAGSCKIWHLPSSRQELASSSTSRSNASDPCWKRVCTECLEVSRYVRKQLRAKKNVDEATKARRQDPSSHFPLKYLSPNSKTKRARNTRQQRSRLKKQVLRFYKRTKTAVKGTL